MTQRAKFLRQTKRLFTAAAVLGAICSLAPMSISFAADGDYQITTSPKCGDQARTGLGAAYARNVTASLNDINQNNMLYDVIENRDRGGNAPATSATDSLPTAVRNLNTSCIDNILSSAVEIKVPSIDDLFGSLMKEAQGAVNQACGQVRSATSTSANEQVCAIPGNSATCVKVGSKTGSGGTSGITVRQGSATTTTTAASLLTGATSGSSSGIFGSVGSTLNQVGCTLFGGTGCSK